jgi:hypothetical protein
MGLWRVSLDAIGAALNLGSVMLKDGVGATLAKIAASGSIAEGDNVLGVQAPVLGVTSGARVITDANGTLQQYLRGIASLTAGLATEATLAKLLGTEAVHKTAITVAQTTAAAIITTTPCPGGGIRVWSPDGTGGSTANTDYIAVGYTGLTLANAAHWLAPGDEALIPCSDALHVFAVSATAAQTLRWEVL